MKPRLAAPRIAIIGSGFGGIALAIALRKAGITSFAIYERAGEIGGVWRDNAYPGCACDVPSRFYCYSFEQPTRWSSRYAPQPEILAYLKHCADKYGVTPHIRFNTGIAGATFDEMTGNWRLDTAAGERIEARVLVSAVGLFNNPAIPDIPGRESFAGVQFHSARWDHGCDLAGRRVAVIGTGASAIQFVPEIAPLAEKLYVFQRTPQYVFSRSARGSAEMPQSGWRDSALGRQLERFKIYLRFERGSRRRGSDRMTRKDEAVFRRWLETSVGDPDLRRRLTPDYRLGCKRVLRSDDWYPALLRPNVELVDTPIAEIGPDGVVTRDGMRCDADVIIYGTGFTPTDYLTPMIVTGTGGRDLGEAWRDGAEAYLGTAVAGFPNFFMLYGPNTNTSGSIVYMLESEAAYVARCIRALMKSGARTLTVRSGALRRYNEMIQRRIARTVLVDANCHSYFRTATGKVTTQWPGFMLEYRLRTRLVKTSDYAFA